MFHVKPIARDSLLPATTEPQGTSSKSVRAITRVETAEASYQECVAWLMQIMQASPVKRTETKQSLWKQAQEKWAGTLSERSFIAARAEAIRLSGAKAWGAAGATKKSLRKSPR